MIMNTDVSMIDVNLSKISRVYPDNAVCIAVSCSGEYAPYLSVYLESIVKYASESRFYDIVVFERSISQCDKERLKKQCTREKKNINLRFYNPSRHFRDIDFFISRPSFKEECYYRIIAPIVFQNYDKILFTDVDLCFIKDPANIYDIDIQEAAIAAIKDPIMAGDFYRDYRTEHYLKNVLRMSNPLLYLNTGVLLFQVEPYIKKDLFPKILDHCLNNRFKLQEQDAISSLLAEDAFKLPLECNYTPYNKEWAAYNIEDYMPQDVYDNYARAKHNAIVVHWAGATAKPWDFPNENMAEIWWSYAQSSPYYEEIVARSIDFRMRQSLPEMNSAIANISSEFSRIHFPNINRSFGRIEKESFLLFVAENIWKFRFKKIYFSAKKVFAFGKRHEKYKCKYDNIKHIFDELKKMRKKYLPQ